MSDVILLRHREVDAILRYPPGRVLRLARKGLMPHIVLPDGEVRIRKDTLDAIFGAENQTH